MLVTMNPAGRITLPASARRRLGLKGETQLEVEVTDDTIILRPVIVLAREDAWAYTADHRRLLAEAHEDSRAGRVRTLDENELEAIVGV